MIWKQWFAVVFLAVVLPGCAREQVADLVLNMALSSQSGNSVSDAESAPTNIFQGGDRSPSFEQMAVGLSELNQLHTVKFSGGNGAESVDVEQVVLLVDRVQQASDALAQASGTTKQAGRPYRAAQLAALNLGAQLAPERLTAPRDAFCQKYFHTDFHEFDGAATSAMHILNDFLAAKVISRDALSALTLHALSYPDCPMNPQLFSALAERLANEGQPASAAFAAQEGLRLCSHLPGIESLQRQAGGKDAKSGTATRPATNRRAVERTGGARASREAR